MSNKKILVVDDEADIREVARVSLEVVGGYEVATAASGPEGMAAATAQRPDAILMDVMMPGMDGLTAFARLQADEATRHIPVVLLTAKVQSSDRNRFSQLAVAGVLSKPFDPMTLAASLEEVLGWK